MLYLLVILRCIIASTAVARSEGRTTKDDLSMRSESDLRRDLFQDYDKLVRPVKNPQNTIRTEVSMTPIQLNEVNVLKREIVLESWITMRWNDDYFEWDPVDYSNMTALRIPPSEIWKPDVAVYSATPDTALFPTTATRAIIYHYKSALWVPYFTIRSRCPMLARADKNILECNIQLGSWTYDGLHLDLQLATNQVNLKHFADINPEWKVLDFKASREEKYYDCCPEPYPLLHFNITLQRRHPYRKSTKNEVWSELN